MKTAIPPREHEQSRSIERRPCQRSVRYSVASGAQTLLAYCHLTGNVVDFSDRGFGIETDHSLAPGHTLWFLDGSLSTSGTIRWCTKTSGSYRAGIELASATAAAAQQTAELPGTGTALRHNPAEQLNRATGLFLDRLRQIEHVFLSGLEDEGNLLPGITAAFDDVLASCAEFEQGAGDMNVIHQARRWFHDRTDAVLGTSQCIRRARTWPQGHQGDYKTLEYIYKNTPLSSGFGRLLDSVVLNVMLAGAVRKRIGKLSEILAEELSSRRNPSVLNIACGSCRELMAVVPEITDSDARFTCVDSDGDALDFALDRLANAGLGSQMIFRKYNAIRMFDEELNRIEFGKQDVIYSLGLFDYLPSDFLVKMFRSLYTLLAPGGTFIAAFKDSARYRHQDYHWIFDWDGFQQRDETDFRSILAQAGIPDEDVAETRDETGIIVFYQARKR